MKYLLIVFSTLFVVSCKKDAPAGCNDGVKNQDEIDVDCGGVCSPCAIQYPETGAYGKNILFGTDTVVITEENSSMKAVIPEGSSVKIELELISGESWFFADEENWSVSAYSNNKQTFTNIHSGIADLELNNADTTNIDTILIRYFENGNNETKRKILIRK